VLDHMTAHPPNDADEPVRAVQIREVPLHVVDKLHSRATEAGSR
jgi:hypothetical protein